MNPCVLPFDESSDGLRRLPKLMQERRVVEAHLDSAGREFNLLEEYPAILHSVRYSLLAFSLASHLTMCCLILPTQFATCPPVTVSSLSTLCVPGRFSLTLFAGFGLAGPHLLARANSDHQPPRHHRLGRPSGDPPCAQSIVCFAFPLTYPWKEKNLTVSL